MLRDDKLQIKIANYLLLDRTLNKCDSELNFADSGTQNLPDSCTCTPVISIEWSEEHVSGESQRNLRNEKPVHAL